MNNIARVYLLFFGLGFFWLLPLGHGEELVVSRTGPEGITVTRAGEIVSAPELKVAVVPRGSEPPGTVIGSQEASLGKFVEPTPDPLLRDQGNAGLTPRTNFSGSDRLELEKWRRLSLYPVRLTVSHGLLSVEWAGVSKSVPLLENEKINLQLAPQ